MTEEKKTTLGLFFPPLWLLGAGALGAVALCVYIGAGVLDTESRRASLEASLKEHQYILRSLPLLKQDYDDLREALTKTRAQKEALEASLTALREQEQEARRQIARRDSALAERDEAARTLRQFQEQQKTLLKEKTLAEQEKLQLERQLTRLRGELPALQTSVERARGALADLQARTQAQQRLHELVQQEQKTLEGFTTQLAKALRGFSTAVENMTETGRNLSEKGTLLAREADGMTAARTTVQQRLDEALRALEQLAATGTEARKNAENRLAGQLDAMAATADSFSRQLAAGQQGIAAMTRALHAMRQRMEAADRPLQDVMASAAGLEQLHSRLAATLRDVQALQQQLRESAARHPGQAIAPEQTIPARQLPEQRFPEQQLPEQPPAMTAPAPPLPEPAGIQR